MKFYVGSFTFPDKCFGFRLKLVDESTEIVPGTFELFIKKITLLIFAKIPYDDQWMVRKRSGELK